MRAVIIGAGKVGFNIAEILSKEGHDVIVVEHDEDRAKIVEDNLDVQVIVGNGASSKILERVDIHNVNLMVAVTESDELNMLACMLAKQSGVNRTVARVRDPDYAEDRKLAENPALAIDLLINPERVTAMEIAKLIKVPEAINVNYYAHGQMQLLELKVGPQNIMCDVQLKNIRGKYHFLVAAIIRHNQVIIPRGDDYIKADDIIFVMAKTSEMLDVEKVLGFTRRSAHSVILLGGSRIAFYLAQLLEDKGLEVKIIEKNYAHCKRLATLLDSAIILNGDGSDIDLLQDEGISDTDIFVALTEDDKLNLLVSLLAKRLGAKKTIAQIRRSDYVPLIETVGIDVAISPRLLTAEAILKFVRKGDLLSLAIMEKGYAEVFEIVVSERMHKLVNKQIKNIHFPKGTIVAAILRQSGAIIPSGDDYLLPNDRVTIFADANMINKVQGIIS